MKAGPRALVLQGLIILLFIQCARSGAQAIPEPNLIMYGRVWNPLAGPSGRVTAGALTWAIQPTGGGNSIILTQQLSALPAPYSYLMQVPCESQLGTLTVSSNVLQLTAQPIAYNRAAVLLNGQPIFLKYPTQTLFSVSSLSRGRLERVDLTLLQSDQDSNGNGLPDGWQMQYFGHLGVDPNTDPDHDGMSNLSEYLAGTNPTNANSAFRFTGIQPDSQGGNTVEWLSAPNRTYSLLRSTNPLTGYDIIATGIGATPPSNTYLDSPPDTTNAYFYRVTVP
jgi:hypothetical protein